MTTKLPPTQIIPGFGRITFFEHREDGRSKDVGAQTWIGARFVAFDAHVIEVRGYATSQAAVREIASKLGDLVAAVCTLGDQIEMGTLPVFDGIDLQANPDAKGFFTWNVALSVHETWVADGFELTDDRALNMLAHDLRYANIGAELRALVLSGPPDEAIATAQGYRTVSDFRSSRKR